MKKLTPYILGLHEHFAVAALFFVSISYGNDVRAQSHESCQRPVLTVQEAAELLRIHAVEVMELAESGELPARRIAQSWRFNCAALMAWLNGDWELIDRIDRIEPSRFASEIEPDGRLRLTSTELSEISGAGTAVGQAESEASDEAATTVRSSDEPIGEAPVELTAEDVFLRSRRVLLGPGQAVLDFGQFYAETNGQPFAAFDGQAVLATLEQESFITSIQGRVGLRNETELFVGTSYVNQDSDAFYGGTKLTSVGRSDFGPIGFGVRHTFLKEGPGRPDLIGTLSASVPTGDSSYAIGGGLAFVKSIDPAVLFASLNYAHTFSEDFEDITLLEPEDRIDASIGYALALNDTLALSMAVGATFTGATSFPNARLRQLDTYSLRFGLTSWLAPGVYIEPSLTFDLGGPDDSFVFGVAVPYSLAR